MEDVSVERIHSRPIKLFELADWVWETPGAKGFTLFVAAQASVDEAATIRRFASEAVASGCGYVCAWGQGCELVHDLFEEETIAASRFVISTSHDDEPLHDALYFALVNAIPENVSTAADSAVVLAVQKPWLPAVQALIADQEELARLFTADE